MENNSGEKSLVDEINLNWNSLPIKYDNFMEMYAAKEDEQSEQEIINKRELQNAFKHALTFKQAPLDNKSSPKKVISEALKAQDIPKETINNATKELTEKEKLIGMLDEAISALEFVIAHVSRPVNEQNSEKQTLLHLVKKDFMKQQKYLMTAVQNYFPKNEKEAHLVLNKLFDVHFENVDKFIDASSFPEVIVQGLVQAELVEYQQGTQNMIKLRQIL